jgi:hypothetical protein
LQHLDGGSRQPTQFSRPKRLLLTQGKALIHPLEQTPRGFAGVSGFIKSRAPTLPGHPDNSCGKLTLPRFNLGQFAENRLY